MTASIASWSAAFDKGVIGFGTSAFDETDTINVVVCSFDGHTVGIAVRKVLDIVSDAKALGSINADGETVAIDGQVTDVVDVASIARSELPIASGAPSGVDERVLRPEGV